MSDSKVDIASQALARLGEPSISSLEEDSDTAEKVNRLYETTVLSLLSAYDWSFANRKVALVEDASAAPVNEWERGFLLPTLRTDRVGKPIAVFNSTQVGAKPVFDYEISDRWVYTDQRICVVEYVRRVQEAEWPGYFTTLAIEAMAAMLALPVTENASKDTLHRVVAFGSPSQRGQGGLFGAAMEADATGNPTRGLLDDHDPMSLARFGGVY